MIARAYPSGWPRIHHRSLRCSHTDDAIETLVHRKIGVERSLDTEIDRRHQMGVRNIFPGRQLRSAIAEIEFETAFADRQRHREPYGLVVDAVFVQPIDRVISAGSQA